MTTLHEELRAEVAAAELPGIAVLASRGDTAVFEFAHGTRSASDTAPIDRDTIFGLASITKSVVATAILVLEQQGTLHTDDLVTRWLPELRLPDEHQDRLRIRHLLNHTSGFPGLPLINGARTASITADPDRDRLDPAPPIETEYAGIRTVTDLVTALGTIGYRPLAEPGARFNYSNEGYGLLHGIIEAASGTDFAGFVTGAVLTPLGITRAAFTVRELSGFTNVVGLHAPMRDTEQRYTASPHWWDVAEIYSNGSLKTSAAGLSAFAGMLSRPGAVLSAESVRKMTTADTLPDGSRYGLGIEVGAYGDHSWFGHGGSVKGVASHFRCVPGADLTVAVLINATGADAARIADLVARRLLGLEPEPVAPPVELPAEAARDYAGYYRSAEQQALTVAADGPALRLGANSRLHPAGPDLFVDEAGKKHAFLRAPDGAVDRVFSARRVLPKQSEQKEAHE
ncbi:serine hydrolase domain-containing protein [Sciscionella sediminilitoris]|uniref:serine hydrolase domain-containing protein n=1 Tax=Sciscionella sediminilitoris TaxID=1445613 RepID=UPI0004DEE782|nr:serine hydrolase domain-containing protein [Sciscionella sp. SE31]